MSERCLEIYSDFNSNNYLQLAKQYGLTVSMIYRTVKAMCTAERDN